jgi:signal transduction histidine kinase/ActR/RegA family two-component response regulator
MDSDDVIVEVANTKIPIVHDTLTDEQSHQNRPDYIQSGIYMPLITGENFIGVLALESDQARFFDNNTLNLLQALTGSFSAVIQNSRLLRDIQEANERLREVDKLKTNFLAAMSHELRTPLNSIIGFSRVILKGIDGPVTEMQEQDLQTIHDSGKHLLGLVNDILDQAKIEAGKMELSLEYFDIAKVIKSVMSTGEGLTKEKTIRLYTEIDAGLPEVYGDEFRTRQILFNLISNAAKFTAQGSITTSAHLAEEDGVPLIVVSVTDTGIGIREEDFAKLFESFQQVDSSTTRAAEGTGLGLPLARSLAELQGGTLRVESEFGVGSTFSVTFQTEAPPVPEEAASAEVSSNGKSIADVIAAAPKTVMVVEDSVDMINFCRRHLSNDGFDVVGATRLDDVQGKLMTTRFAAIIINVSMNDDAGWNILDGISKMELPITIPTITSSLQEDEPRSQQYGAAAHLIRPFSPEDLVAAVRKVTETVSAP